MQHSKDGKDVAMASPSIAVGGLLLAEGLIEGVCVGGAVRDTWEQIKVEFQFVYAVELEVANGLL